MQFWDQTQSLVHARQTLSQLNCYIPDPFGPLDVISPLEGDLSAVVISWVRGARLGSALRPEKSRTGSESLLLLAMISALAGVPWSGLSPASGADL